MTRIFTIIAALNVLSLLAALISGLVSWLQDASVATPDLYLLHFLLGLTAALTTLFVHCLVLTYFLGTGRWVKEVCLAYGLPDTDLPRRTRDIKRRNTPRVIFAMLLTIAATAAGMGKQLQVPGWPGVIHFLLVCATVTVNLYVFVVEYGNMRLNAWILDTVMAEVERIRAERGLPSSEEALRTEDT
jgi:hypothetical protein